MSSWNETKHLFRKEFTLEFRNRYALFGVLLYLFLLVFVVYLSFDNLEPETWNALYWITLLFVAVSTIARSFIQESHGRQLYYYAISSAGATMVSKIIYNTLLMILLAAGNLLLFAVLTGWPIVHSWLFLLTAVLGAIGFAASFTLMSSISSKTNNNIGIMAILSLPTFIPMLMMLIACSSQALLPAPDWNEVGRNLAIVGALDVIEVALALILFSIPLARLKAMISLFYKLWWKYLTVAIILGVLIAGFVIPVRPALSPRDITFPDLPVLRESIRNTFFHVPMWFGMVLLMFFSLVYSIKYLSAGKEKYDCVAASFAHGGLLMGFLGLATGTVWGVYTWAGDDWSNTGWIGDPKILGAMLGVLIYLAYFVLRGSMKSLEQRARISAVYSIFGFAMFIVFIFVMPRLTDSLHPGNGGNPGFGELDLDNTMRAVFYPAIIGWTLLGSWLASLRYRALQLYSSQN